MKNATHTAKNSFLCYLKAMRLGINSGRDGTLSRGLAWEIFCAVFSGVLLIVTVEFLTGNQTEITSVNFGVGILWVLWAMVLGAGVTLRARPSALRLLPINYGQRVVYFILFSIISTAVCLLVLIVFFAIMGLLIALAALASTGEWIFVAEESSEAVQTSSLQGGIFEALLIVLIYAATLHIVVTKSAKVRYVLTFSIPAVLAVIAYLFSDALIGVIGDGLRDNVFINFDKLPLSWLWLAIIGIITAAVAATAVIRMIKFEKPKDF